MTPATVTLPVPVFHALVAAAHAWQKLAQWEDAERQAGTIPLPEYLRLRQLVSVEDCGVCGRAVELPHPWKRWQVAMLPDVSWVRCARCQPGQRGAA
jgi:hypothetical protein